MKESVSAIKVVLGTKKEVLLREPRIKDQELAMQAASSRTKDNPMLLVTLANREMLKILLIEVNGKSVPPKDREQLDNLFTLGEYNQLQQAIAQLTGGAEMGEFQTEIVTSGGK